MISSAGIVVRPALVAAALLAAGCMAQSSPVAPSPGPWRFAGTVSSTAGGPIAGADLTVVDGVNQGTHVSTDASGHYEFARLEGGVFRVTIAAPGFVSVHPLVDLFTDLDVNFALQSAP